MYDTTLERKKGLAESLLLSAQSFNGFHINCHFSAFGFTNLPAYTHALAIAAAPPNLKDVAHPCVNPSGIAGILFKVEISVL